MASYLDENSFPCRMVFGKNLGYSNTKAILFFLSVFTLAACITYLYGLCVSETLRAKDVFDLYLFAAIFFLIKSGCMLAHSISYAVYFTPTEENPMLKEMSGSDQNQSTEHLQSSDAYEYVTVDSKQFPVLLQDENGVAQDMSSFFGEPRGIFNHNLITLLIQTLNSAENPESHVRDLWLQRMRVSQHNTYYIAVATLHTKFIIIILVTDILTGDVVMSQSVLRERYDSLDALKLRDLAEHMYYKHLNKLRGCSIKFVRLLCDNICAVSYLKPDENLPFTDLFSVEVNAAGGLDVKEYMFTIKGTGVLDNNPAYMHSDGYCTAAHAVILKAIICRSLSIKRAKWFADYLDSALREVELEDKTAHTYRRRIEAM